MAPLQAEAQPGRFVPRIGPPGGLKVIHRLSTGYPQGYTWPHMTVPRMFHEVSKRSHSKAEGVACGSRGPTDDDISYVNTPAHASELC